MTSTVAPAGTITHPTLDGQVVVGFQGWFAGAEGSRSGRGWDHWFSQGEPDAAHLHVDMLPDMREFPAEERCVTAMRREDGTPVSVFSDENERTVARQFEWMRGYGIDAAALQRFVVAIDPDQPGNARASLDRLLTAVRHASLGSGRGLYLMYDIAGADRKRWVSVIVDDWRRQLAAGLTRQANYQHHHGRPVLAIVGIGGIGEPGTPDEVVRLVDQLRRDSVPFGGLTLIATTPLNWRTRDSDAKGEPGWDEAYARFDIISPWTVGRYRDAADYDAYVKERMLPDIAAVRRRGQTFLPVIYPGFSWSNLNRQQGERRPVNEVPRAGGQFLWMQAARAKREGATMLYAAMFDELDEGTALFKLDSGHARVLGAELVGLDSDGARLPSDWYLRVTGTIGRMMRGAVPPAEALPVGEVRAQESLPAR